MGGVLSLLEEPLPHKAPPSGHKRPLATHMRGAVLAFPDRIAPTPVAFVIGLLNCVSIERQEFPTTKGSGYVQYVPPSSRHAMVPRPGVGRSGSSPYRRGATAASGSDLSTRQFIR